MKKSNRVMLKLSKLYNFPQDMPSTKEEDKLFNKMMTIEGKWAPIDTLDFISKIKNPDAVWAPMWADEPTGDIAFFDMSEKEVIELLDAAIQSRKDTKKKVQSSTGFNFDSEYDIGEVDYKEGVWTNGSLFASKEDTLENTLDKAAVFLVDQDGGEVGYIDIGELSKKQYDLAVEVITEAWNKEMAVAATKHWSEEVFDIVKNHQAKNIDGYMLDATTANMLKHLLENLQSANLEKFKALDIKKAVNVGWKLMSKVNASTGFRANWLVGEPEKVIKHYNAKLGKNPDFDFITNLPFATLGYDMDEGLKFEGITDKKALEAFCEEMRRDLKLSKSEVKYY